MLVLGWEFANDIVIKFEVTGNQGDAMKCVEIRYESADCCLVDICERSVGD